MDATARRQFVELQERHFWFVGRRRIFFWLLDRELRGRRDLRVLEVGCGAGGMLEELSRYGKAVGLDISTELVSVCRSRGLSRVAVASGYDLPVRPSSVDLIALFDTIEHIPDDRRVLRQCLEALRPGGLVFLSVPAYQFLYSGNDRLAHHLRRYTARMVRERLREAGFTPVKVTYFNTFLFPVILPIVLFKKGKEALLGSDGTTNLSHRVAEPINRMLAGVMASERHLLSRVSLPFGHSLIGMGRRPAATPQDVPEGYSRSSGAGVP